jgi:hypothetical protein
MMITVEENSRFECWVKHSSSLCKQCQKEPMGRGCVFGLLLHNDTEAFFFSLSDANAICFWLCEEDAAFFFFFWTMVMPLHFAEVRPCFLSYPAPFFSPFFWQRIRYCFSGT